jgi:hypothetical protein
MGTQGQVEVPIGGQGKQEVASTKGTGYLLHVIRMLGRCGVRVEVLRNRAYLPLLHDLD